MNAMLATILTIATVGVLAIPPPAQAASVYIDEFINSTTATKAV